MSKVLSEHSVLATIQETVGKGKSTRVTGKEVKAAIKCKLVGTMIYTAYNNTPYTVESVEFGMCPANKFTMNKRGGKNQEEEEITINYADYLLDFQGVKITDMDQPLLRTSGRNKQRIYLVPEVCLESDIPQRAKEKLPQICSVKPQDRIPRINALPELLRHQKAKAVLDCFKLSVNPKLLTANAKTIPPPFLTMPGVREFQPQKSWGSESGRDLKYDLKGNKPIEYTAYVIYDKDGINVAKEYSQMIKGDMESKNAPLRINITPVEMYKNENPIQALKRIATKGPPSHCMLICVLGERDKVNYGIVKEFTNKQGIISQCINLNKQQKGKEDQKATIVGNIMKQILNKHGFLCWKASVGKICPSLGGKTIMLIGIDVYHAKKRYVVAADVYMQRRSVGAFIAIFINVNTGDYLTSNKVIEVTARKELICKAESDSETSSVHSGNGNGNGNGNRTAAQEQLETPEITSDDALQKFIERSMKEHQIKPDHIIVYRDGVGDSMLEAVTKTEVKQVQNACKTAKLIYAICQKRIHTRFFVDSSRGLGNPPPGTVINDCSSTKEEFFLISTKCTLSTVRPVRYVIIANDQAIPMAEFQALTFAMCHVYPNWPDTITLPFPTQLAHKLAYQMGESCNNMEVSEKIHKTYFYL
jgi:aubergine-like protein